MPISGYFGGHGEKVMHSMKEQYGEKKGKQVFYATANKRKKMKRKARKRSEIFERLQRMAKEN